MNWIVVTGNTRSGGFGFYWLLATALNTVTAASLVAGGVAGGLEVARLFGVL